MRKIFSLIAVLVASCTAILAAEKQDEVHVNNLVEFIHAMKSNRIIYVDSDIDFGKQLERYHNYNPQRLPDISEYDVFENMDKYSDRCFVFDRQDGYGLFLAGFKNLTIKSASALINGQRTLLRVSPRYADVLMFINCSDITIDGFIMGHTDEGYCEGGVLSFRSCKNVRVDNCDLYGCGIEGITLRKTLTFTMTNSIIRDCSYSIMTIVESNDCTFENCHFFRNREFALFDLSGSKNLTYRNCFVSHNEGILFGVNHCENILFEKCSMMHKLENIGDPDNTEFKDCRWSDEYGAKR